MEKIEGVMDSFLGDRSRLEGTLSFNGTLTLLGKFKGKIVGGEEVVLAAGSESEADVEAGHVAVHGRMTGSIKAERGIEIYNQAEVDADLVTPSLVIQEGAIFDGKSSMKRLRGRQAREKIVDLKDGWILSE